MPTVHVQDGFRILINTHDHAPAHVHVWHQGDEVVIEILNTIRLIRSDRGFNRFRLGEPCGSSKNKGIFIEALERNP